MNKSIPSSTIHPSNTVTRSAEQMSCELDRNQSEIVVLNTTDNQYFGLEQVGGRIWQLITEPLTVEQIVACLVTEFEVSEDQCRADVLEFLEQAHARGLITVVADSA